MGDAVFTCVGPLKIEPSLLLMRGIDHNFSYSIHVFTLNMEAFILLKANRLHPRNYPHAPTDYRHTVKHLRLVMTLTALCCTRQSRSPKRFSHESGDGWTDGQTDGRTLPSTLSPSSAVDKYGQCSFAKPVADPMGNLACSEF